MKSFLPRIRSLLKRVCCFFNPVRAFQQKRNRSKLERQDNCQLAFRQARRPPILLLLEIRVLLPEPEISMATALTIFSSSISKAPQTQGQSHFLKFGIIFGKRNQNNPVTINLATQEPDLSLTTDVKGIFGNSEIARLRDLNQDGIDDIVLTQERPSVAGRPVDFVIKIFFGSKSLQPGVANLDVLQPDLKITPDSHAFITNIAGVADVNGDGIKDLMLSEDVTTDSFALPILLGPFAPGETIDLDSTKAGCQNQN